MPGRLRQEHRKVQIEVMTMKKGFSRTVVIMFVAVALMLALAFFYSFYASVNTGTTSQIGGIIYSITHFGQTVFGK